MSGITLSAKIENFPLRQPFVISRGTKTQASVVMVTLTDGTVVGRGECVPYARYGETPESVANTLAKLDKASGRTLEEFIASGLPPGAARNALDCALWDLKAKREQTSAAILAGQASLCPRLTCYTISLGAPDEMAAAAAAVPDLKLLKLKLGGDGDDTRMHAVRKARPDVRLVADANEAWTANHLRPMLSAAQSAKIELIEQPLPADDDAALEHVPHLVPICADESAHTSSDITKLRNRYDAVNIKLDKTGGLTEALVMLDKAKAHDMKVMVGSMVSTSLAIAPAFILAQTADWVDLDGPLLLARDRSPAVSIENGLIQPPPAELWG